MNCKTTKLRDAIAFALVSAAGLSTAGSAIAQEAATTADEPTTLDRIEVTGSRIRRVDAETASPVFTLERAQIEATGAVNIGDFLQETPAISGAATNPQVNNGGGTGAATVSLRGLGSQRTLLLVNGRRLQTNDVNSIPINMVERVEVLKDGASAIYGSDAIGGVVNFILRKDYEGASASVTYGTSSRGDGATTGADVTMGASSDRGSLVIGLKYDKQDQVRSSDRDHSRAQAYYYYGEIIELGSSRVPNGRYVVPRSVAAAGGADLSDAAACGTGANVALIRKEGAAGSAISDFRCFVGGGANNDAYNFQVANINVTPQERRGLFANASYQLTDNVEAYVEGFYNTTTSSFEIASEPFDGRPSQANIPISAANIYNPFGVDITDARLRLVNVGPRTERFETNEYRNVLGLKGNIGESSWSWDAGWVYGQSSQTTEARGELFRNKLIDALGPSFIAADGTPTCGTLAAPIAGCVPVNFFGPAPAPGSDEFNALQAIAPFFHDRTNSDLNNFYATITGDLFELPGGAVQLAVGLESTKETLDFQPDNLRQLNPITNECETTGNCSSAVKGELSRDEIYAELYLPILADAPFAERLALTLGSRYSDYSAFGDTTNSKIGLEWKPFQDLLIRGTFAEVFRSPTISDLFSPVNESADSYVDPCNGTTTNPNNACQNVPLDGTFDQSDSQLNASTGGNPNLTPEEGWVRTIGFVYSPSWAEGLSFTVDAWQVKLENNIGALGSSNILQSCYNSGNFCNLFTRDAAGEVATIDDRLTNPGRVDTNGFDFSVKYALRDTAWGDFRTSLDTTYTARYDRQVIVEGLGVVDSDDFAGEFADLSNGGEGHFARWRALGNVVWSKGDWSANYSLRYIHHVDEQVKYSGGLIVGPPELTELRVPSITYHDLSLAYNFPSNAKITLGVDNLTDKTAPLIFGGFNGSTDVRTYDTIGRFYWMRASINF
jgi:outer membrane receptor protein involved in Fe transport